MAVEHPTADRQQELVDNYDAVKQHVDDAARSRGSKPRLVAVSKLKPSSDILALYDHGVRHFGENYPQELEQKANELPHDIQWHFIGALQSNKAKMLASIPNLFAVETLTSTKAANTLNSTCASLSPARREPLNVYIQLNTSGEESKSGLAVPPPALGHSSQNDNDPSEHELFKLAKHVLTTCQSLKLKGLMTIGSIDASFAHHDDNSVNPDFDKLTKARDWLLSSLRNQADRINAADRDDDGNKFKAAVQNMQQLELSMGMSEDFAEAIKQGSSNVRVGSKIFGARPPRKTA
ncbi:hypothetical protein OIV83_000587 [Microbotryomycetes sp. JL201]|nr:hypothetical protein OIV83_000587 [Microbotryomycetes sp. JL201]